MITKEQYELVPDFLKAEYEEQANGEYESVSALKVSSLKTSLDNLDAKLTGIEAGKSAEIEAAKEKALEDARSKNDVTAIEERYKQEMADLEIRVAERTRGEVETEYTAKQAQEKAILTRKIIAKDLGVNPDAASTIEFLLTSLLRPNEQNQLSLYDMAGSATSIKGDDAETVKAELKKLPQFKSLIDGSELLQTKHNGLLNGNGGSANNTQTTKKLSPRSSAYLSTIR